MSKEVTYLGLSLTPPEGFEDSEAFTGLAHTELEAFIVIGKMQAPFPVVVGGFTAERMAAVGMKWLGQESFRSGSLSGRLVHATQALSERWYTKWIGILGNDSTTYLITATIPRDQATLHSDALRRAVLSARIVDSSNSDPSEDKSAVSLSFQVTPQPPFKHCDQVPGQLVFTPEGRFPPGLCDPLFIAGGGVGAVELPSRPSFCRERFQKHAFLSALIVTYEQAIEIDQLPGIELRGTGFDSESQDEWILDQFILFDSNGYFILQGMARREAPYENLSSEDLATTFVQMAMSFRRN